MSAAVQGHPAGGAATSHPAAHRDRLRDRTARTLWLLTCVVAFCGLCWLLRDFVADDAWISARYADNLADGLGAVWNPGGPRVEGFSNPLLIGVEAVGRLLSASPVNAARTLGVGSGIGLLLVIHRLGPETVGDTATRSALGLTALCPPLALWAVGGLETLPAALVLTTGALLLCRTDANARDAARAGAVLALLPWLRPEGLVVDVAIGVVAEAPGLLHRDGRRSALGRLVGAAGLPVVSQLMLEVLRFVVFAHPLPNSVLYKSGSGVALEVVLKFAGMAAPLLALAAAGLVVARGRQRLLAVPPLAYAVGSIGTLDSANAFSRFFLPTWPLLALLAGLTIPVIRRRFGARGPTVAAATSAALVLGVTLLLSTRAFALDYSSCRQQSRSQAAAWLRENTPMDAVFSISDAGLVPALSGGRTAIDQFLLNEPVIQTTGPLSVHRRVDMTYDREPDVLVLASSDARRFRGFYPTDREMQRDPRRMAYGLATVTHGDGRGCGYNLFIYRRRPPGP